MQYGYPGRNDVQGCPTYPTRKAGLIAVIIRNDLDVGSSPPQCLMDSIPTGGLRVCVSVFVFWNDNGMGFGSTNCLKIFKSHWEMH